MIIKPLKKVCEFKKNMSITNKGWYLHISIVMIWMEVQSNNVLDINGSMHLIIGYLLRINKMIWNSNSIVE